MQGAPAHHLREDRQCNNRIEIMLSIILFGKRSTVGWLQKDCRRIAGGFGILQDDLELWFGIPIWNYKLELRFGIRIWNRKDLELAIRLNGKDELGRKENRYVPLEDEYIKRRCSRQSRIIKQPPVEADTSKNEANLYILFLSLALPFTTSFILKSIYIFQTSFLVSTSCSLTLHQPLLVTLD